MRVQRVVVDLARHRLVLQREHRLDQAGGPGRGLQMTEIRLDRAQQTAGRCPGTAADRRGDRLHLDRIAERRAGSVRFDEADAVGRQLRARQSLADQRPAAPARLAP